MLFFEVRVGELDRDCGYCAAGGCGGGGCCGVAVEDAVKIDVGVASDEINCSV